MLSSFRPPSAICRVRGIGVAVMVRTCTSARSCLRRSLCATPKCCSSSITTRPRSLNATLREAARGFRPRCRSRRPRGRRGSRAASLAGTKRESCSMRSGRPAKRSRITWKCWRTRSVVGARIATCRPAHRDHERGAQRHLGLAEADVAADQPIHRLAGAQIVEHRLDRARPGRRSPRRQSAPRTPRTGRPAAADARPGAARAAPRCSISSPAISRIRFLTLALRACQPRPPSLSSGAAPSAEP